MLHFGSVRRCIVSQKLIGFKPRYFSDQTAMKDEYDEIDSSGETYITESFKLESGKVLKQAQVRYNTYGSLNSSRDNVVIVCHALTGNSRVDQWWSELLGPGRALDTDKYLIVCANVLGSCYGTSGPKSTLPDDKTGLLYGTDFPKVTIRDTVRLHARMLTQKLKVNSVQSVIGGSMGGMQALEWMMLSEDFNKDTREFRDGEKEFFPRVRSAVSIGCGAQHTAWQIGISEVQRQAVRLDDSWTQGGSKGLFVARQIAMITYRCAEGYQNTFGRRLQTVKKNGKENEEKFQVCGYLDYQGEKFIKRFDPISYIKITEQMDTHDLARGRLLENEKLVDEGDNNQNLRAVLNRVRTPLLVIGISSDSLYPVYEQKLLKELVSSAELKIIDSPAGHDGFLIEHDQVNNFVKDFFSRVL